jgi:hypothetical protein
VLNLCQVCESCKKLPSCFSRGIGLSVITLWDCAMSNLVQISNILAILQNYYLYIKDNATEVASQFDLSCSFLKPLPACYLADHSTC